MRRKNALVQYHLIGGKRDALERVFVLVESARGAALPFADAPECDVRLKRRAFGWESDGFATALDAVL